MDLPHLEVYRECVKIGSLWQEIIRGNFLNMRKRTPLLGTAAYHACVIGRTMLACLVAGWWIINADGKGDKERALLAVQPDIGFRRQWPK